MLGIVMNTKDRSEFVIRHLLYYAKVRCPYTIYIGDSSSSEHIERMNSAIDKLKDQLKIVYKLYPGKDSPTTVNELLALVEEEYVSPIGDDDFLVPNSIEKCLSFLESHPEYSVAHGKGVVFSLDRTGAYGNIKTFGEYLWGGSDRNTSTERLFHYLTRGWNSEYAVHRTEEFVEAYGCNRLIPGKGFSETISNSMMAIQGKSKQLDCLHLFRQVHPQRYMNPPFFERLVSPDWYPSCQVFQEQMAKGLEKYEGLSFEDASETAKQALFQLLKKLMKKTINQTNQNQPSPNIVRETLKQVPGVKALYSQMIKKSPRHQRDIRLELLLQPSSPYHKNFMPVYQAITSSEKVLES
jgi:glycosyltransferase domain-containing protein